MLRDNDDLSLAQQVAEYLYDVLNRENSEQIVDVCLVNEGRVLVDRPVEVDCVTTELVLYQYLSCLVRQRNFLSQIENVPFQG